MTRRLVLSALPLYASLACTPKLDALEEASPVTTPEVVQTEVTELEEAADLDARDHSAREKDASQDPAPPADVASIVAPQPNAEPTGTVATTATGADAPRPAEAPRTRSEEYKSPGPAKSTAKKEKSVGIGMGSHSYSTGTPSTTTGYGMPSPAPSVVYDDRALSEPRRADPTAGEDYKNYGVNGFDLVEKDPLSTFAIDVDTASYTITRRKLREGYLPPQSAVRVEEFVNYLPYEYKRPTNTDPFSVDFEAAPSPWNPQNKLVRVGVQGKRVAMDDEDPVHLTFLVDVSGSMSSTDKMGLVKDTLKMLTEELDDGDTVAIATYAGNTSIVLEPTPMSRKADVIKAIDRLNSGGSTAMGAGIDLAYGLADRSYVSDTVNRVILCSDGDANVGITSHDELSKRIKGYAQKGITLTTLGFGNGNYQDTMMEQLANDGDGNYFYIDSLQESRRIFVDKLSSTMEVIAKDVKIQVDWNPDTVLAYRLIGYENRDVADVDFRNDKVDAGEIGSGHQVTALYEVALRDNVAGTLATVRVRNKAPGPEAPAVERSFALDSKALRGTFAESSDQFRIAVASASFAEILRGSPYMGEATLRQVEAMAKDAARAEYREDAELVQLIGEAARLKGEGAYVQR